MQLGFLGKKRSHSACLKFPECRKEISATFDRSCSYVSDSKADIWFPHLLSLCRSVMKFFVALFQIKFCEGESASTLTCVYSGIYFTIALNY